MTKFLCKLGLHDWLQLGLLSIVTPWVPVFECLRCHKREARYGYAIMTSEEPKGGWTDYVDLQLSGIEPRLGEPAEPKEQT